MLRALWQPRLIEAVRWIAGEVEADRAKGRAPKAAELFGKAQVAGVELYGKVDRIDVAADGTLAIIDYKTGKAPSAKAVAEGFALQLGLLALIAERGGFEGITGTRQRVRILVAGQGQARASASAPTPTRRSNPAPSSPPSSTASPKPRANISPAPNPSSPSSTPPTRPTATTTS